MTVDKKFFKKIDFWFGIGCAAVLLLFWTQIPKIKADAARVMPSVVIVAGWICCALIVLKAILTEEKGKKKRVPLKQTICLVVTLAISVGLILLSEVIGMYTCLFLMICCISLSIMFMEGNITTKKVLVTVGYDLIVILFVYVMFSVFLKVSAPAGILI